MKTYEKLVEDVENEQVLLSAEELEGVSGGKPKVSWKHVVAIILIIWHNSQTGPKKSSRGK